MAAGTFTANSRRGNHKIADLEGIFDSAAHSKHDHGLEGVQVGQAVDQQSSLRGTNAKVDHGAIHFLDIDNHEVAFVKSSVGLFLESPNILLEVGDEDVIANLLEGQLVYLSNVWRMYSCSFSVMVCS